MVNEAMKTPRWNGTFISGYLHKKMQKCQESKTTSAIFGMMFYYSFLLYGTCFFNFILYQTLGPKLISHFVGMHMDMGWKIIMETQITIDPLNEII
jgi:hypothetical protein